MPGRKAFSPDQRRRALKEYMRGAGHTKILPWTNKAGVSEGTLRNFLNGDSDSLSDRTYSLLADADGVPVSALMGRLQADEAPAGRTVPIRYVVGSSDEIVPVPEAQASRIELPPGLEEAEALEVQGRWLVPLYHEKDVLLYRRAEVDPLDFPDEVAVVQLKNGKRFLRFVQPSDRKGRFTLSSFNPAIPRLEDQQIAWVGPILWVRKRPRT